MTEIMTTAHWAAKHGDYSFWEMLIGKVNSGEMELVEAQKRHNYFMFAREMMDGAWDYVMEADAESLPPVCFVVSGEEVFDHYVQMVKDGRLCAYDAAQAYYDEMMGGR